MTEQTQPDSPVESKDSTAPAAEIAPVVEPKPKLIDRLVGLLAHRHAPFVALGLVALGGLIYMGPKLLPRVTGQPNIVVFDPVRFVNSQRAAASILAARPNADLTLTMTQVAKQAEAAILEEADGAVVLIRQAVVVPDNLRDITDDVLKRFGLPTKVPTVTNDLTQMTLENLAPTNSSFSSGAVNEDYRMELESRALESTIKKEKQSGQEALIP